MARVKFNIYPTDSNTAWGYPIEKTETGVFGEVPEELLALEIEAGRVQEPTKAQQPIVLTEEPKKPGRPAKTETQGE